MATMRRWGPAGLVLLLSVAACDLTSVETIQAADVVVAEVYLQPGPELEAFIYRTLPGHDGSLRVDGATVEIVGPSVPRVVLPQSFSDSECASYMSLPHGSAGTCYRTVLSSYAVEPGETYRLSITTADGRVLEGTTTVPGDFEIRRPAGSFCTLAESGMELLWTRAGGARSYQVAASFSDLAAGLRALGVQDPPNELELVGLAIGAADTTIVFPKEFGVFDRFTLDRDVALALQQGLPAGARADIVVAAGDRNYVNWVRGGNFNPSGQVRVPSIEGDGTGVFGSLVTRRVTILSDVPDYPSCQ